MTLDKSFIMKQSVLFSYVSYVFFKGSGTTKVKSVGRTKGEGLTFTAKGSRCSPKGKCLHLIVAIAYGKGVILIG